jgi:signal transduction histidine kinase
MSKASVESQSSPLQHEPAWRDPVLLVAITLLTTLLSAHFELNESLFALTRHMEYLQLDEWPAGMLVLLIGLIWLSFKRQRYALRELQARRRAEATLAKVLIENRQLAQENLRIQELERKHLARELHDELGQYLNAIKLDAVSILDSPGIAPTSPKHAAGAIISAVDHIHSAVTQMIGRLRPVALDELGLIAAIEHCMDYWRERLPSTRFALAVNGDWERLGEALNLTVYRLIQECLTNVYKHAHATRVSIELAGMTPGQESTQELRLTVIDDGCGLPSDDRTSRFGLKGMRERVAMLGGTLSLDSAPGRGVRLAASFPAPRS